jgi:hypothetical protein
MRIEECAGCGVFFTAERPPEAALMQLYKGDALLGDRPGPLPKGEDTFPRRKMKKHEELLNEIVRFGASTGSLLDVGCFSDMFLRNARERGFEIAGIEPNEDAFVHARSLLCPIDDVPWHLWGFTRGSFSLCVEKAGFVVNKISWLEPSPLSTNRTRELGF